jgi:hypothetical protein
MFQHSKRIRWVQGIVKRWVMEVGIGLMWLMIRYSSGLCKHGKEASSSTAGRQKAFRYFGMTQMDHDFSHRQIRAYSFHILTYNRADHKTQVIVSTNSCMFRHKGAIFREFIKTNGSYVQHVLQIRVTISCIMK